MSIYLKGCGYFHKYSIVDSIIFNIFSKINFTAMHCNKKCLKWCVFGVFVLDYFKEVSHKKLQKMHNKGGGAKVSGCVNGGG